MASKIMAMTADGRLTWCSAPEDKRGQGRCPHIAHQEEGEDPISFQERVSKIQLKQQKSEGKSNILVSQEGETHKAAITTYRMSDEEKESLMKVTGRKDLADKDMEGGYIELETPLWNDVDKNMLHQETGIPTSQINAILRKDLYVVTELDEDVKGLKLGQRIPYELRKEDKDNPNCRKKSVEKLQDQYGDKIKFATGVEGLNEFANQHGIEGTKEVYVLPYYMRPDPPNDGNGGETKHPLNGMYNKLIIKRKDPDAQQRAYQELLDNEHQEIPAKGFGGYAQKGLSNMLRGKGGLMRKEMSGRRIPYSGRSLITPDPDQKYGEIKIPPKMAVEMYKPSIEDHFIKKGWNAQQIDNWMDKYKGDQRMIPMKERQELERVIDSADVAVVVNRQPSLHYSSMLSFKPKISPDGTSKINPLNVEGYGADFDGDQMTLFGINSSKVSKTAINALGAGTVHGTKKPSDRSHSIIQPSKESRWGLMNILAKRSN